MNTKMNTECKMCKDTDDLVTLQQSDGEMVQLCPSCVYDVCEGKELEALPEGWDIQSYVCYDCCLYTNQSLKEREMYDPLCKECYEKAEAEEEEQDDGYDDCEICGTTFENEPDCPKICGICEKKEEQCPYCEESEYYDGKDCCKYCERCKVYKSATLSGWSYDNKEGCDVCVACK